MPIQAFLRVRLLSSSLFRVRLPFQAFLMSPLALIKPFYRVRLLFKPSSLSFSILLLPLVRLPSQVFLQCPLALQAFLEVRLPFQAFSRRLFASQAFILSLPGLTDLGLFRARVGTVQVIADGLATGAFPLSAYSDYGPVLEGTRGG